MSGGVSRAAPVPVTAASAAEAGTAAAAALLAQRYDVVYVPLGAATYGGAERSLLELASAQQALGRRVLVCAERALASTDFPAHAAARALALLWVDWSPEASTGQVLRAAWQWLARLDTAVLHFNISWRPRMWLLPLLARLRSRARVIGTMRAMPTPPYEPVPRRRHFGIVPGLQLWRLRDWLADALIGRAWAAATHLTVSVNRDDYPPRLVREFGFSAKRLAVVYNGVNLPPAPTAEQRLQAKRRLGFADADFLAAYVGRISPEKGIHHLVEALPACHPSVRLAIAGDGPQEAELKAQVQRLGLTDRVRFLGYVSEPQSVFTAAEAVVVPSLWNEAFGRVVVEAMGCGAVAVASAVGGMQEIFDDGAEGLLVPKADAAAIAAALNRLATDPGTRARLALAGRRRVETQYSTARVASEYDALYRRLSSTDFTPPSAP